MKLNFSRSALFHTNTKVCLIYFGQDCSYFVKKTDYNSKISEIENKIQSINGLATTSALTAVKNKIPNVNSMVKQTDYNTKVNKIEKKITDHSHDK